MKNATVSRARCARSWSLFVCLIAVAASAVRAEETVDDLRREVEKLRKEFSAKTQPGVETRIERHLDARTLSAANPVQTKAGKLKIGGLLQIWAYSIQNDSDGWVDIGQIADEPGAGTAPQNETVDNDGFAVRRAELRFTLDIHENIRSYVSLDFAREATGFPSFPTNQNSGRPGDVSALYYSPCQCDLDIAAPDTDLRGVHNGTGIAGRLLQDAWIEYHGVIPHHDVRVGLMKRELGDEGTRDSNDLDFIERSMMTQPADLRDIGLRVKGQWFDSRLQYVLGVFNGAGSAYQALGNRSDTEDAKDLVATLKGTPLKHETWGELTLGYSVLYGVGGEAAGHQPGTSPLNGLNRRETTKLQQYAWLNYAPGGKAKGLWIHGEWAYYRNRFAPSEAASGLSVTTFDPAEFAVQGFNAAIGYKFRDADCVPQWARPFAVALRYDVSQNLFFHDLVSPERRLDVYKTTVWTAGLSYDIVRDRAKLMLNYNWVQEEDGVDRDDRQVRETRNDSLVASFSVAF